MSINKDTELLFKKITSCHTDIKSSSEFISRCWGDYINISKDNSADSAKNKNGQFCELLIEYILCKNNLTPFYKQARVAFVPNVNFDFLLYTKQIGPLVLSVKTSLRERYKQADLEAIALKQVHRKSKTFLLTLSDEYSGVNNKIELGDVIGLEKAIKCQDVEFDDFINSLKQYTLIKSNAVEIVIGNLVTNATH